MGWKGGRVVSLPFPSCSPIWLLNVVPEVTGDSFRTLLPMAWKEHTFIDLWFFFFFFFQSCPRSGLGASWYILDISPTSFLFVKTLFFYRGRGTSTPGLSKYPTWAEVSVPSALARVPWRLASQWPTAHLLSFPSWPHGRYTELKIDTLKSVPFAD